MPLSQASKMFQPRAFISSKTVCCVVEPCLPACDARMLADLVHVPIWRGGTLGALHAVSVEAMESSKNARGSGRGIASRQLRVGQKNNGSEALTKGARARQVPEVVAGGEARRAFDLN